MILLLAILTDWEAFRSPDIAVIGTAVKKKMIFDGHNLYEPEDMRRMGFDFVPVERGVGAQCDRLDQRSPANAKSGA